MPRYKRPEPAPQDPYKIQPLPINSPVSVYYRQSSEAQIGNISTTLQTVNMVEHLERLGWPREHIIMIDMDAGISGMKRIDERPGMRQIMDMIERQFVRAVAAQDVDRFFRDVTQIETNKFIDACRRNNVLVLTPTFVYDFSHPTQGRYHMQMFRESAQRAADFIEYQIRGRLVRSRHFLAENGQWSGRRIIHGYMVDDRKYLPDGSKNPDYRKYTPFAPHADVIAAHFEVFRHFEANFTKAWKHIEANGPFFPEIPTSEWPDGFLLPHHRTYRSRVTGQLCPSPSALRTMLTNVVYIGHWVHKDAIVRWHNHEAIVPLDLFMYAFNALSAEDFLGDPNEAYTPQRPRVRLDKEERGCEPPIYADLVFSDDLPERPHAKLFAVWSNRKRCYQYGLNGYPQRSCVGQIKADILDAVVDAMLLERLKATTIDEAAWQVALDSSQHGDHAEVRRIENAIQAARQSKEGIIGTLSLLNNREMVRRAEAQYEAANRQIEMLTDELERLKTAGTHKTTLLQAKPALEKVTANWNAVPRQERRSLFESFAKYVEFNRTNPKQRHIIVHWRDGSTSSQVIRSGFRLWSKDEIERLRLMVESHTDQVEILRTFPDHSWESIQDIYSYNCTPNRHWFTDYAGKRPYPQRTRWQDTLEYKLLNISPESSASCTSIGCSGSCLPLHIR
jgi:DNA invertase Pin-like site-specific DNA recombinase